MSEEENKVVSLSGARDKKEEVHHREDSVQSEPPVYCSFCGRPNTSVLKMIKGPGVNICSECTLICVQYLIIEGGALSEDAKKLLQIFWQGKKS